VGVEQGVGVVEDVPRGGGAEGRVVGVGFLVVEVAREAVAGAEEFYAPGRDVQPPVRTIFVIYI